eukprot:93938-Karenia_brevis.AAC.1
MPWPVNLVLSKWNKKHILCSNAKPKSFRLAKFIHRAEQRLKWRWVLRDSSWDKPSFKFKRNVKVCTAIVDDPVYRFIHRFKYLLLSGAQNLNSKG